jgi:dolichyl-phosphate-mannose--protein O-mannosyl transferase
MPTALWYISFSALAATTLTLVVIVFGPQEGLETLAGGLLAYFTLLYHIVIAPAYLYHW